jgi:hypothetical protein
MRLTMIPPAFAVLCACRMTVNLFARRSTPLRWFMTVHDATTSSVQE